ncbi:two-component system regulatory protein YycI [Cytobacillus gottheilii]|uniref:Two-component system regulatory protein YycI n=1 Tax=Cytobacillus gottheilii TaxID=859144 RepID=A0ABX8FDH4_9BACI|nr:two-component system regulatory protein YycI [Cytobacillus gottheilii]QVY61571.1 two-component system regulatory protein YycI [Cytobacillus gottheilii]
MDWSKIKTIFIIAFLVLDVYLIYEFSKLRDASQLALESEASVENRLRADGIEFPELKNDNNEVNLINAERAEFTEEDLEDAKFDEQSAEINRGKELVVSLDEPYAIDEDADLEELNTFLDAYIIYADQYAFWEKGETTITFYQTFEGKMFYKNNNGRLTLFLNPEGEIVSYTQTLLTSIEDRVEVEDPVPPLSAMETLYQNGKLLPNSVITDVEIGYYTFLSENTTTYTLTPVWRFVVKDQGSLYVNVKYGDIIDLSNIENN